MWYTTRMRPIYVVALVLYGVWLLGLIIRPFHLGIVPPGYLGAPIWAPLLLVGIVSIIAWVWEKLHR